MGMNQSFFKLVQQYGTEYVLTGIIGVIPTPIGRVLRNVLYRLIFPRVGKSAYIQPNVRFIGTKAIEIGDNVRIYSGTYVSTRGAKVCIENDVSINRDVDIRACEDGEGIFIGEGTYIAPFVCIAGPGKVQIGKDCMIASHSSMYANNHRFMDRDVLIRCQGITTEGIVIEDDCWLGTGVRVVDGVRIGKGSVIGAGAVVTRNIPPYSIAVGVPARVIGTRGKSQDVQSIPLTALVEN